MTLTTDIYSNLMLIAKSENAKPYISKMLKMDNGAELIYSISKKDMARQLYFSIGLDDIHGIPECNGLKLSMVRLYEYSRTDVYCEISQNIDCAGYIFEIIVEDIRKEIASAKRPCDMKNSVANILLKWKSFFAQGKKILLSSERQQGLFGELLFLREAIDKMGTSAVSFWTGHNYETHDFYIRSNAVEVKTTSTKAPYKMHISSEYQLDRAEIKGKLYICFFALRKSIQEGKTLPELINEIRQKISGNVLAENTFNIALENYGYIDGAEIKYDTRYFMRDNLYYEVGDDFPSLTTKNMPQGVSNCTYDIMTSSCSNYTVEQDQVFMVLKGCNVSGR